MRITVRTIAAMTAGIAVMALFASCKGRTLDNVETTGETIEVNVEPQQEMADSVAVQNDSVR